MTRRLWLEAIAYNVIGIVGMAILFYALGLLMHAFMGV